MSEERMVQLAQAALDHHDIRDTVLGVGQFAPRGQSGSMFVGGLPANVLVAVSETAVYGTRSEGNRLAITHSHDVVELLA